MSLSVSVCVACYKQDPFLGEAVRSCNRQTYPHELCIYYDDVGVGTGEAFNRAIRKAKGDIVVLLCSDDVFTDEHVIEDIVREFEDPLITHVSRWYHQFIDEDRRPVRSWRGENVIELANNPSGMSFRREDLRFFLTNKMFVEVAEPVFHMKNLGSYSILRYDTVAVRIHKSISRTPSYYLKNWNSSPVLEWAKLGWKSSDFTHLIQVKNNFKTSAVIQEAINFIKINPWNLIKPSFWFFSIIALITPRPILYRIPEIYRSTWGRWTTREVKRNGA
jgi:glycosyltransferase involved in cell wall biosynthesis